MCVWAAVQKVTSRETLQLAGSLVQIHVSDVGRKTSIGPQAKYEQYTISYPLKRIPRSGIIRVLIPANSPQ